MKKTLFYLLIALLFSACSFKTPSNEWQYKSVRDFNSYTENFLSSNDDLAKNDLARAVEHAKSSADLSTLARIHLGECALNISVGIRDNCAKYVEISDVAGDNSLDAYYAFLTSAVTKEQIELLPKSYQNFAMHVKNSEFAKANRDILSIEKSTSKLLSSALIKENIEDATIDEAIKAASFNGYKKAVLFWLNEKKNRAADINEKNKIIKKISILERSN